jgi:myo-inositol-1(or 4)-monophosphatase
MNSACEAALAAGEHLRADFGHVGRVTYKRNRDPVTQADLDAESIILEILGKQFPQHRFLSEESGERSGNSPFLWVIDSLDGTINFLHSFPSFAVSIALLTDDVATIAVIYQPISDELYTAVRGQGAFLSGTRLHVSKAAALSDSLLATGFGASLALRRQQQQVLDRLLQHGCGAVREPGSAALGLCYVAQGVYDGYWELGLQPWDLAAGALLVTEAGGVVTGLDDRPLDYQNGDIVATNGWLHQELLTAALTSNRVAKHHH